MTQKICLFLLILMASGTASFAQARLKLPFYHSNTPTNRVTSEREHPTLDYGGFADPKPAPIRIVDFARPNIVSRCEIRVIENKTPYIDMEDIVSLGAGTYQQRSGGPVHIGGGR